MTPFTRRSVTPYPWVLNLIERFHRWFPRPVLANPEANLLAGICSDIHGICILALTLMIVPQTVAGFHNGHLVQANFALLILQLVIFRRLLQAGYMQWVVLLESFSIIGLGTAASYLMGTTRNAQVMALVLGIFYTTLMLGGRFGLVTAVVSCVGLAWVGYLEATHEIEMAPVKVVPQILTACMVFALSWIVAALVAKVRVDAYNAAADDRNEKQVQLEALNASLETTVAERTGELQTAVLKLEQAKEAMVRSETLAGLGSLVAGVSHEMNTPMGNALLLATSLQQKTSRLLAGAGLSSPQDVERYVKNTRDSLDVIVRNITRLDALLQSFRSVAVDQTSMRRRTFDLEEVLGQVRDTLTPMIERQGIELVFSLKPGIKINSYPGALEHVVMNLVSNAINHAFPERPAVAPAIGIITTSYGEWVEISVRDNGIGMDEHTRQHAFDLFFTTKMGQGGTGIGLALAHQLVTQRLGGRLELTTSPGNGVEFKIVVPRVAPEFSSGEDYAFEGTGDTKPGSL